MANLWAKLSSLTALGDYPDGIRFISMSKRHRFEKDESQNVSRTRRMTFLGVNNLRFSSLRSAPRGCRPGKLGAKVLICVAQSPLV